MLEVFRLLRISFRSCSLILMCYFGT